MKYASFLFLIILLNISDANAQNINVSGTILTNTTWDGSTIDTVKVIGNLILDDNVTLTITPGIVVDFTDNYYFNIEGNLFAVGNSIDSVHFTTSDTSGYYNNTHHGWSGLRFHNQQNDSSRIQFASIQYGKADGSIPLTNSNYGGGIYCYMSNKVYITNISMRHNMATALGGAFYSFDSHPANVTDNSIANSEFKYNEAGDAGGAIYTSDDFTLTFDSCEFLFNNVIGTIAPRSGGAIASSSPGAGNHPRINNSRFGYNTALSGQGGAIYLFYAGIAESISNSTFHNNQASNGGAIYSSYRINIQNSILVNNEATNSGGALYCLYPTNTISKLYNCTIANNKADAGGGLFAANTVGFGSQFFIPTKTIFHNNQSTNANNYNGDVFVIGDANFTLRLDGCSLTADLTNVTNSSPTVSELQSLLNTDPLFIVPSSGIGIAFDGYTGTDWSINFCTSPCVDASLPGNFGTFNTDFAGSPRKINDIIDIGAFEAYGFLTHPQDLEVCEGDTTSFSSSYYHPGTSTNSWIYFTVDGGINWWADFYSDTYTLSNNTPFSYDGSQFYVQHDFGCGYVDSDTASLIVNPTQMSSSNTTLCDDSLFVEGAWQSISGVYYDTIQSTMGCDSILQTNLTIGNSFFISSSVQICQGDSIEIFGNYESVAGNYYDSLSTIYGCDSIYMMDLSTAPIYASTNYYTLCPGDSVYAQGTWQNSTGIFIDTYSTANGCDSIVTSDVIMNTISTYSIDTSFCQGLSVEINSTIYSQSGSFNQVFTNSVGCDSILTINIIENALPDANIGPDSLFVCDGELLSFGIDTSNIDTYAIGNFIITSFNDSLHFTFDMSNPVVSVVSEVTSNDGCTSTDQITIVNNSIMNMSLGVPILNDPFVDFSIANMPQNVDFWYWSFGDGDTLSGNPTPTHEYLTNGNYDACLIAVNQCGPDTTCFNFNIEHVGIQEHTLTNKIYIYPNPVRSLLNIESNNLNIKTITIIDLSGKLMKIETENTNTIDVSNLPLGVYLLEIQTDDETVDYHRFIKH
ncbi:MAG: putative outer membrane repeat protein [Crocinitomicaceae bacterium]|jgi:predicted outer membrane repeat protein